jgi:D-galactarolactone cycloisomerase
MEVTAVEAIPLSYDLPASDGLLSGRGDVITERGMTLIKIETDTGFVGWGEAFGLPRTNAAVVNELVADLVVGTDPHEVESLQDRTTSGLYHFARRGAVQSAIAGVDLALWDVLGKAQGKPVHQLLGGPTRDAVTPYASTMMRYDRTTETVENDSTAQLRDAVEAGFTAAKIKIGRGIDDDVRRVKHAREVLGPDADLMVDMNGNYRTDQAIRAVEALEPYDLTWVEEPILPNEVSEYSRIKRHTTIPLAAGEASYARFEYKELVEADGVDIVQPDLSKCGFSEGRFVATLATTTNTGLSPHCWNGPVALAAALQFAGAAPTYPHTGHQPEPFFLEVDQSANRLRDELLETPLDTEGASIPIPDDPGLGIQPDPDVIDAYRC